MRLRALLVVLALLPLAGCFAGEAPVEPAANETAPTIQVGDRPEPSFNDIPNADLGFVAQPDLNATLAEAPKLIPGEWWRIEMMSPLDGRTASFVRVVAKVESDLYVMGMPHEGWYKEAVIYHVPFFGDVNKDLSGHAHDVPFLPLKFPLTNEQTWTTSFEGGPELTATVTANDADRTAEVVFTGPNGGQQIRLVYDAKVHEIVEFEQATITYKVVEHGYGFEGWVTVPRGEDLVFFHGRIGPAIDVTLGPAAPLETVLINGGFNRVTFIVVLGAAKQFLGLPADGPGVYRETMTAPDGTSYDVEGNPDGSMVIEFFENAAPDGEWQMQHVAGGVGVAFVEGIAYHQYDIHLPTGNIRTDHSHEVVR